MIRAVLDANVFVSGIVQYGSASSPPAELLRRWLAGSFELVTSDSLGTEIEWTLLTNPYFVARVDRAAGRYWIAALASFATNVALTETVAGVASHPEDDLVLATAVSAAADFLVTGDKQLLLLGSFRGVAIVSPRDFLVVLDQDS